MSILTANLRLYYQCRSLWFLYIIVGFMTFAAVAFMLDHRVERGQFAMFLVVSFLAGLIGAGVQKTLLAKPLTYCLPGHRDIPRRIVFLLGGVVNGALAPIILACREPLSVPGALAAAFMAGMAVYLLVVLFVFRVPQSQAFIGFLPVIVLLAKHWGLGAWLEQAIVFDYVPVIGVGGLICLAAWNRLGWGDLARQYFGRTSLEITDFFDWDKARRYRQSRKSWGWQDGAGLRLTRWEPVFVSRMAAYGPFSAGRYIWGSLYPMFGFLHGGLLGFAGVMIIIGGVCAFMPPELGTGVVILSNPIAVLGAIIPLPWECSMLLPGSRRHRFWSMMVIILLYTLLVTFALALAEGAWRGLAALAPEVTLGGRTYELSPPGMPVFYLPLLLLPIGFALQGFIRNRAVIFFVVFGGIWGGTIVTKVLVEVPASGLAAAGVAAWALVAVVCHRHYARRDLVRQGRS